MGFFNNLSETIANTGRDVANTASRQSQIVLLNNQLKGVKDELTAQYIEIGRSVCESGLAEEGQYTEAIARAEELKQQISVLEGHIRTLHGVQECPGCGSRIRLGAQFCPSCGRKIEPENREIPDNGEMICPRCGKIQAAG